MSENMLDKWLLRYRFWKGVGPPKKVENLPKSMSSQPCSISSRPWISIQGLSNRPWPNFLQKICFQTSIILILERFRKSPGHQNIAEGHSDACKFEVADSIYIIYATFAPRKFRLLSAWRSGMNDLNTLCELNDMHAQQFTVYIRREQALATTNSLHGVVWARTRNNFSHIKM